jgi:lipid-A-disaccharide synthase
MLEAARIIGKTYTRARFTLGLAPLIDEGSISIPADLEPAFEITADGLGRLGDAHLVIAASGTVTLQSAMSGTPIIAIYKTSPITFNIGRRLVNIPHIAMPNVLAGHKIIPELLQSEANAERIANEAMDLLNDKDAFREISADLLRLRESLFRDEGIRLVAEAALRLADGEDARGIVSSFEDSS